MATTLIFEGLVLQHKFVELTSIHFLLQEKFQEGMTATSAFAVWFLNLSAKKKIVLSCPDSMAYRDDSLTELQYLHRDQWLPLVKHMEVRQSAELQVNIP
mgnify:FL=1